MTAAAHAQKKLARLGTRCTNAQKSKVQRAAELCGNSITDFTINTLMEKADKIIKQHCLIDLSMKDQLAFANALLDPPAPNRALLKAKQTYERLIRT